MNITMMKDILESNFDEFIRPLQEKFANNRVEIQKLEERQEGLNQKLRDTYRDFGLDNCVSNMDEIDELNGALRQIESIEEMNEYLQAQIMEYEKLVASSSEEALVGVYNEAIENAMNQLKENESTLASMQSKDSIKKEIEELHNAISQSMIIFDVEERPKKDEIISNIYKENAQISSRILKLTKDNREIVKMSQEAGFTLPAIGTIIFHENDEVVSEILGVSEEELDNVENIDVVREIVSENPDITEDDSTWDEEEIESLDIEEDEEKEIEDEDIELSQDDIDILDSIDFEDMAADIDMPMDEFGEMIYIKFEALLKGIYGVSNDGAAKLRVQIADKLGVTPEELEDMKLKEVYKFENDLGGLGEIELPSVAELSKDSKLTSEQIGQLDYKEYKNLIKALYKDKYDFDSIDEIFAYELDIDINELQDMKVIDVFSMEAEKIAGITDEYEPEQIIKDGKYHIMGKDFDTIEEYREYFNGIVDSNTQSELGDASMKQMQQQILVQTELEKQNQSTGSKVKSNYKIPVGKRVKNQVKSTIKEAKEILSDKYYVRDDDINENNSEYNRKKLLQYIAKKYKIDVVGTHNMTDEDFANEVCNQVAISRERFDELVEESEKYIETNELEVSELFKDFYNLTEDEYNNLTESEYINMIADYFGEEPSPSLNLTDDEVIEKLAHRFNTTVKKMKSMKVNTINGKIRRDKKELEMAEKLEELQEKQKAKVEETLEAIKNFKLIKGIGKLAGNVSSKIMSKIHSGETIIEAGSEEDLDIVDVIDIDAEEKGSR